MIVTMSHRDRVVGDAEGDLTRKKMMRAVTSDVETTMRKVVPAALLGGGVVGVKMVSAPFEQLLETKIDAGSHPRVLMTLDFRRRSITDHMASNMDETQAEILGENKSADSTIAMAEMPFDLHHKF